MRSLHSSLGGAVVGHCGTIGPAPEDVAASRVYHAMVHQTNNGAAWLGTNSKLTRIKFEGGLASVLGIRMLWTQFGALYALVCTDTLIFPPSDLDQRSPVFYSCVECASCPVRPLAVPLCCFTVSSLAPFSLSPFCVVSFSFSRFLPAVDLLFEALQSAGDGAVSEAVFVAAFGRLGMLPTEPPRTSFPCMSHSPGHLVGGSSGFVSTLDSAASDAREVREAFEHVCDALETASMTVDEAFSCFDRNASGSISVAEFLSLMRVLCKHAASVDPATRSVVPYVLPRRLLLTLLTSADADMSRSVSVEEFRAVMAAVWPRRFVRRERHLMVAVSSGECFLHVRCLCPPPPTHTHSHTHSPTHPSNTQVLTHTSYFCGCRCATAHSSFCTVCWCCP
jgi:hypothetical protein